MPEFAIRQRGNRAGTRSRGALMFGMGPGAAGSPRPPAPVLTSPNAGTPTADGTNGANVTTDQGTGRLYWAVVTNGGSATDAQLKAGSGGNIVAGKAGSQLVGLAGVLTIPGITGLTTATTYQIKFLQSNVDSKDSAQASVNLTTL